MALYENLPVIPTPFLDGKIEYAGFDRLFDRTEDDVDGYVICGSTGEAPALTLKEKIEMIRFAADRLSKDKELVVGLGETSLENAVEIGLAAGESGVKTALVPSPYYFPNSLGMVMDYVGKLADRTGLELVFYDNPVTTNTHYTAEELVRLSAAVPKIKAIKMTDHDFGKIRQLKNNTNLAVFGGDDIICFRAFEAGVDGNMIIAPIIYPSQFRECWDAYRNGQLDESFSLYCNHILPFISMFGPGDEVPTTKALFKHLGIFTSSETRSPLLPADNRRTREVIRGYNAGINNSR